MATVTRQKMSKLPLFVQATFAIECVRATPSNSPLFDDAMEKAEGLLHDRNLEVMLLLHIRHTKQLESAYEATKNPAFLIAVAAIRAVVHSASAEKASRRAVMTRIGPTVTEAALDAFGKLDASAAREMEEFFEKLG